MDAETLQLFLVPACFVLAGGLGLRLGTPRSIAAALAAVGVGHLMAFGVSELALEETGTGSALLHLASQVLFFSGFVSLLWIVTVFPRGGRPGRAVIGAGSAAALFAVLGSLAGATPAVVDETTELGPLTHLLPSRLADLAAAPLVVLPAAALVTFVVRLLRADGEVRRMMWWPVVGVAVVALLALAGTLLGSAYPGAGDAAFLLAAPVVPLTVAFGPVRRRLLSLTDQTSQLTADLAVRVEELEESRHRLAVASEAERRRIERDLHDGAQQELLALIAQAEVARTSDDPAVRERALDQVAELAHGAYDTVREVSHGVRPSALDDLGLAVAVRAVAERSPIPVLLELAETERLDAEVSGALLLFATEALANVLKHAEATSVTVRLREVHQWIELEVEDDGVGGADAQGQGLQGLRDRIDAVGGRVEIDSRPGRTLVKAAVPDLTRG